MVTTISTMLANVTAGLVVVPPEPDHRDAEILDTENDGFWTAREHGHHQSTRSTSHDQDQNADHDEGAAACDYYDDMARSNPQLHALAPLMDRLGRTWMPLLTLLQLLLPVKSV
jgi:hypothetical protein